MTQKTPGPTIDGSGIHWLATTADDGTCRLWNAETGERGATLLHPGNEQVWSSAFAPGRGEAGELLLATGGGDGSLHLWDIPSGKAVDSLKGHRDGIRRQRQSPWPVR
ncbi:MAG: hypothetical protein KGQ57_11245 [Burkholderiales bacterium]|nr:hypothetical protein [Burkholderiales bacterium]